MSSEKRPSLWEERRRASSPFPSLPWPRSTTSASGREGRELNEREAAKLEGRTRAKRGG